MPAARLAYKFWALRPARSVLVGDLGRLSAVGGLRPAPYQPVAVDSRYASDSGQNDVLASTFRSFYQRPIPRDATPSA
jgi:hypothetical protein